MTSEELKRLAGEARKLAMECVDGTAPALIRGRLFDAYGNHCAMGLLGMRVGNQYVIDSCWAIDREAVTAVTSANNVPAAEKRHPAVVFPLLWLADSLEDAATAAKENP